MGQTPQSLAMLEQALEICLKASAADPRDAVAQRYLCACYQKLAGTHQAAGDVAKAIVSNQKCLEITEKLAAADPASAQAQIDLAASLGNLANARKEQKQYEQAVESYERGLKVLRTMKENGRLPPANDPLLATFEQFLSQCRQSATALGDWKTLLEQPAAQLASLLELRGRESIHAGRVADAIQAVAKLRELGTATAEQLYNAACVYSSCAAVIKPAHGTDALSPEQAAARQQHIAAALATLREAIAAGFKDFAHMQQDPDFAPLRDLPEFKALLPK